MEMLTESEQKIFDRMASIVLSTKETKQANREDILYIQNHITTLFDIIIKASSIKLHIDYSVPLDVLGPMFQSLKMVGIMAGGTQYEDFRRTSMMEERLNETSTNE